MTANSIRQRYTGGLTLSQLHIGLAVGLALIVCVTAFGGGVIVGMWYKASEQHSPIGMTANVPSPEPLVSSPEAAPPRAEGQAPVTFYNTLTNNNVAYAPLTPPPPAAAPSTPGKPKATIPPVAAAPVSTPESLKAVPIAPPAGAPKADAPSTGQAMVTPATPVPASPLVAMAQPTPSSAPKAGRSPTSSPVSGPSSKPKVAAPAAKAVVAQAPAATPAQKMKAVVAQASVATPAQKTKTVVAQASVATPAQKTKTVVAQAPALAEKTKAVVAQASVATPAQKTPAVQKPVTPVRQPVQEPSAPRVAPAAEAKIAKATPKQDFNVQVGSFGSSEQAEKLRSKLSDKGYPARMQLSSVPGQGLRYRVRVGNYAERTAAHQSAQHLTVQEQVPAIVAGKD